MSTIMSAEISAQPAVLRDTVDNLLPQRAEIAALARGTRQVLFIARGSSDNAAVYGSYLIQAHAGRLATMAAPSIATTYRTHVDLSGVLAVGLSQSGETEEIVDTLQWARDCGARTVAVTNGAGSSLTDAAELTLLTRAGPEIAVPATKTYTSQLAALAVLALGLGAELDEGDLRSVPEAIGDLLQRPTGAIDAIVEELRDVSGAVISGRGLLFPTALEAALKLKEACYLHAMGLSYEDLLHGPIAVVDQKTPTILVAADSGPSVDGMADLARRVTAAGAPVFGIGGGATFADACDLSISGPRLPEWLAPLGLIVPAQLLTERLARRLGYDPDTPRGLNKVTQTS